MVVALGLLSNLLLIAGAWLLAGHGLRCIAWTDRILAAAVLAFAWCVVGMEVLGTAGAISIGPALLVSGLLFLLGLAASRLKPPGEPPAREVAVAPVPAPWSFSAIACGALTLWACVVLFMPSLLMPVKVVSDAPI